MTKQPFTIGGPTPLKKALLEETGIKPYSSETCTQKAYNGGDAYLEPLLKTKKGAAMIAAGNKQPIHYQLPEDWDKAVAAVKDFFAEERFEERFEEGKWYYAKVCDSEYLLRFSHIDFKNIYCDEQVFMENGRIEHSSERKSICNINSLLADCMKPATTEQIQFMLGKVAENKGLIGGGKIKSVYGTEMTLTKNEHYLYNNHLDRLTYEGYILYEKGKWAELLPKEETTLEPQIEIRIGDKLDYVEYGSDERQPVEIVNIIFDRFVFLIEFQHENDNAIGVTEYPDKLKQRVISNPSKD